MAITHVHVIFSGIVSLIPHPAQGGMPAGWTIRLQDARSHHMHPHKPSVVAEIHGGLTTPSRGPDTTQQYSDGTHLGAWLLANGSIQIMSKITSAAITSVDPLPNVLAISNACGTSKPCSLAQGNYPGVDLEVTKGNVEATELERGMWKFHSNKAKPQWIAEEVCWSFDIDGTELQLSLPDSRGKRLTLAIRAPGNSDIELRLQNTLGVDVFPSKGIKSSTDAHAQLYFLQSAKKPKSPPMLESYPKVGVEPTLSNHRHRLCDEVIGSKTPVPLAKRKRGVKPNFLTLRINCPPAQWSGKQ
jgi:hypothetical protein